MIFAQSMPATMNKLFLSLVFLLSCACMFGQSGRITGAVSGADKEPVQFASVVLLAAGDSIMAKASITDEAGLYTIKGVDQGSYILTISYVGYQTYTSAAFEIPAGETIMEPIVMASGGVDLEAVTVTSDKPLIEVLADKTVFNVENAGGTAGLSGFELMRRAPGVVVDNNDNVIVEGKSGSQIWIDGKPSILSGEELTQYLRSIQASDIESIEIITQPSSKYDAEGTAGIINIKLKRDKRYGTNGSISTGVAYGEYWKNNNSISINKRTKNLNLFANYSNRFGKTFNFFNFDQQILNQIYQERSRNVRNNISHNLKAGVDIYASAKSTIGFSITSNLSDGSSNNTSRTTILPTAADAESALLRANSIVDWNQDNLYLNGNYSFEDTLGHSFSFDLDVGQYTSERLTMQPNTYYSADETQILSYSNYELDTPIDIELLAAKFDYEQDALKGKIGLGAKISEVRTDNVFDFYSEEDGVLELRPAQSNTFEYTEQVIAGYVNYNYRKDKWNAQAGLRAEQTNSTGVLESLQDIDDATVEREYLNFFPSAGITYAQNDNNSWSLNYSKRINRPNYEDLNPFEQRLNELGFRKGNPFLNPNYADNLKLSHTYKYRYTTSLSYSIVTDFYAQVTDTLETGGGNDAGFIPSFIQARNVADEQTISLSFSAPFDVNDWWSVYMNLSGFNTSYTSTDPKFNPLSQTSFNFYAQNTFKLPSDYEFQVSGWYSGPSIWGGTFQTEGQGSLDLAMQKKFFNKKLSTSLSVTDILYTAPWRARGEFNNLPITGDGGWESRQVRLNLSYSFGNPELKSRKDRKAAAEEELNRIN
jgi:outer membrane receptor protein involved in Fe transport